MLVCLYSLSVKSSDFNNTLANVVVVDLAGTYETRGEDSWISLAYHSQLVKLRRVLVS